MDSENQIKEQNKALKNELQRMSEQLKLSQQEKNEIGAKYQILSERLEEVLLLQVDDLEADDSLQQARGRQQLEFTDSLVENLNHSRNRLHQCQEQQNQQATLICKLQEQVDEYQRKCERLEENLREQQALRTALAVMEQQTDPEVPSTSDLGLVTVDMVLQQLEDEKHRCETLSEANSLLREQLEAATSANQALTLDVQRMTQEWHRTRQELKVREDEWRDEEQSFSEYFTKEQQRLVRLWQHISEFRQEFGEMKMATERDLSTIRTGLRQTAHNITTACFTVYTNVPLQISDPISWELQRKKQELVNLQLKFNSELDDLQERIRDLTSQNDRRKAMLEEKEKVIVALNKTVEILEASRTGSRTGLLSSSMSGSEEMEVARRTLRMVAHSLVEEATQEPQQQQLAQIKHLQELLQTGNIYFESDTQTSSATPEGGQTFVTQVDFPSFSHFAEATLSALQVFQTRKKNIFEELQGKLTRATEQLKTMKLSLADAEDEQRRAQKQNSQLFARFETLLQELQAYSRDKDRIQSALDERSTQRIFEESAREILNEQVDSLNTENERLHYRLREAQNKLEASESEQEVLRFQEKQLKEELNRATQQTLHLTEEETKLRSEVRSLTSSLNRINLEKDILLREKVDLSTKVLDLEGSVSLLSKENEQKHLEINSLLDNLENIKSANEALNHDKADLSNNLTQLKEMKNSLNRDKAALEREQQRLKSEVIRLEQLSSEQSSQIISLQSALQVSESHRQKLETEASLLINTKEDLDSKLTLANHQKDKLTEELSLSGQEVSRLRLSVQQLEQEKEALAQEGSRFGLEKGALESELGEAREKTAGLRVEKERLEVALYAAQQTAASLETLRSDLDEELTRTRAKMQEITSQLEETKQQHETDLAVHAKSKEFLSNKLQHLEDEFSRNLQSEEEKWKKEVDRLQKEKETQRKQLTLEQMESNRAWEEKQEELSLLQQAEIQKLIQEMDSLKRECHLRQQAALSEKTKAEHAWAQERIVFEQRIQAGQKSLEELQAQLSSLRREKDDLSQHHVSLQEELRAQVDNISGQLSTTVSTYEQDLKDLRVSILELQRQRDAADESVTQLRVQVKSLEQARDGLRSQLLDSNRKANELELQQVSLLKSVTASEQRAAGERAEKELLLREGDELRTQVKASDSLKAELEKSLDKIKVKASNSQDSLRNLNVECSELKKSLRDVEQSRQELKREAQSLQRSLVALKGELVTKTEELENQRALHTLAEQREADIRKEASALKQKLLESEAQQEVFRKELLSVQRQSAEVEHRLRLQQESHKGALQESFLSQHRLEEQKAQLEKSFQGATQEIHDLKLKVIDVEGKASSLDAQLSRTEVNRQDLESRLWHLQSSLRYTLGLGVDGRSGLISSPQSTAGGSGSPVSPPQHSSPLRSNTLRDLYALDKEKERSPVFSKGGSPVRSRGSPSPVRTQGWLTLDLDVDLAQNALQDLVQRLQGLEKEKEEWKRKYQSMTHRLEEMKEDHTESQSRLVQLQKKAADVENEKKSFEMQLSQSRSSLSRHEESMSQLEREKRQLQDKASALETQIATCHTRHSHLEDKLSQLKQAAVKSEGERRQLFEAKEKAESKVLKLELDYQSLEGELQRINSQLTDKETENQVMNQRLSILSQRLEDTEEKALSLQKNLDKMILNSHKAAQQEKELKEKIHSLNQSLNDNTTCTQSLLEQQRRHRQELLKNEKEQQAFIQQLENTRQLLSDSRLQYQNLQEKVHQLQRDLSQSESRRVELETLSQTSNTVVARHQESERNALQRLSQLQSENSMLREGLDAAKQQLASVESQQKQLERSQWRLEKDRTNLQKSLDKVERDRSRYEEASFKSKADKSDLSRSLTHLETENLELQRKVQTLQTKLAELEQQHTQRLLELTSLKQQESYLELDRLRTANRQAQQMMEAKEATHKHTVSALQMQVASLKNELHQAHQEKRRRSQFPPQNNRHQLLSSADSEISQLRSVLDQSLRSVSEDPNTLEVETLRLDGAIERQLATSPSVTLSTPSRLSKSPSPSRLGPATGPSQGARSAKKRLDKLFPTT